MRLPLTQKQRRSLHLILIVVFASAVAGAVFGPVIGLIRSGNAQAADAWSGVVHGVLISSLLMGFSYFIDGSAAGRRIRRLPFLPFVATKTVVYFGCILAGMYVGQLASRSSGISVDGATLLIIAFNFIMSFIVSTTLEISRLLGPGVFSSFLIGRYHRPRIEERIFLLIDLRRSTHIAEQIGDLAFHRLLNRFYFDLTEPLMEHGAEIHKYVGDELVATWLIEKGLRDAACVAAVFEARHVIAGQAENYRAEFGVTPEFRGVLHAGPVVTGEMGDVKREIAFLGDTVNTASRIEAFAKSTDANVVLSAPLLQQMRLPDIYVTRSLGTAALQGKQEPIELFAVDRIAPSHPEHPELRLRDRRIQRGT